MLRSAIYFYKDVGKSAKNRKMDKKVLLLRLSEEGRGG